MKIKFNDFTFCIHIIALNLIIVMEDRNLISLIIRRLVVIINSINFKTEKIIHLILLFVFILLH